MRVLFLFLLLFVATAFSQDQSLHLSRWTKVLSSTNYTTRSLSFSSGAVSDSGTVVFMERSGYALTSSDGGASWASNRVSDIGGMDYECKFLNGQFVFASGYDSAPS
jgi:hypothetical protein